MLPMRESSVCNCDPADSSVPVLEERRKGVRRRTLARVFCDCRDSVIAQLVKKVRFHVSVTAGREKRLEEALHLHIAHRADHIGEWRAELPQGLQHLLTFGQRGTTVAGGDPENTHTIRKGECTTLDNHLVGKSLRELPAET